MYPFSYNHYIYPPHIHPPAHLLYPYIILHLCIFCFLPPSSLASVFPPGLIIISKRDSGLLLRAGLTWNNRQILNQAPRERSTRGQVGLYMQQERTLTCDRLLLLRKKRGVGQGNRNTEMQTSEAELVQFYDFSFKKAHKNQGTIVYSK